MNTVTNISSMQPPRRRTSPFAGDPFFEQFFGDMDAFGGRAQPQYSLGLGRGRLRRWLHPDQRPRARRAGTRHRSPRDAGRQARVARAGDRRGSGHRHRAGQDQRPQPGGHPVGRFQPAQDRRVGAGHRQPVSTEPDRHARHRLGAGPDQPGHRRVRGLHPDRCRHQPRQLRRRADQQPRRAHRHQHGDLHREPRLSGHRLCGAEQPGAARDGRPDPVRRGPARLDRRRGAAAGRPPRSRASSSCRAPKGCWSRA